MVNKYFHFSSQMFISLIAHTHTVLNLFIIHKTKITTKKHLEGKKHYAKF